MTRIYSHSLISCLLDSTRLPQMAASPFPLPSLLCEVSLTEHGDSFVKNYFSSRFFEGMV